MVFTGALVIVMLMCQIIFNVFFSKPYLVEFKKSQTENLYKNIKNSYTDDFFTLYAMTKTAEDNNMNVLIFNDSSFIYSNRTMDGRMIRRTFFALNPVLNTQFSDKPKAEVVNVPASGTQMIALNGVFTYDGEKRYVVIETPVESISTVVSILSKANILIFSFALIVGIICAFIFSRSFARPILELKSVAQNVASLKFDIKADENLSTIELSELSASINIMADKLRAMITDLQEKNKRLQFDIEHQMRLDKMRRDFVANVSHELKTPLCLLMLYSENLKNNIDALDRDFYCETIIDEVKKLDEMAKSLLDLSAIENGLSGMKLAEVDFSSFCAAVAAETRVLFQDLDSTVEIEEGLAVNCDLHYLEQAAKNYIVNAVSHTNPGGRIAIRLAKNEGAARFSVYNDGKQIPSDDVEHIWESFYKTDKARTRDKENHAGLGLYIVRTVINAHSGQYGLINHESGVEFWFSVPLSQGKASVAPKGELQSDEVDIWAKKHDNDS
jgi:signal transduction histidine kinase